MGAPRPRSRRTKGSARPLRRPAFADQWSRTAAVKPLALGTSHFQRRRLRPMISSPIQIRRTDAPALVPFRVSVRRGCSALTLACLDLATRGGLNSPQRPGWVVRTERFAAESIDGLKLFCEA